MYIKDFENGKLFYDFTWLIENYDNDYYNKEDKSRRYIYECFHDLIETCRRVMVLRAICGTDFLALCLDQIMRMHTAPSCEITGKCWTALWICCRNA